MRPMLGRFRAHEINHANERSRFGITAGKRATRSRSFPKFVAPSPRGRRPREIQRTFGRSLKATGTEVPGRREQPACRRVNAHPCLSLRRNFGGRYLFSPNEACRCVVPSVVWTFYLHG